MATVRLQVRRGTASQWTSIDPILAAGEMGLESDTNFIKFGDGIHLWSELGYANEPLSALQNTLADYVLLEDVGVANGIASLNASGKVPASQLDIDELSQDAVNTALIGGDGITKTYNDGSNTITLDVDITSGDGLKIASNKLTVDDTIVQKRVANVSDTEIGYLDGVTSGIQTQINNKAPSASPTFTGTVTLPSGTVTSTMIADGTIVNADINATAAIALSKLATDPLARGNHTGSQTASTISDFNEAAQDAIDSALTAGTGITKTYNDGANTLTLAVDTTAIQAKVSGVSDTEIGYLDGVTSAIQTQINSKSDTTAIPGIVNSTIYGGNNIETSYNSGSKVLTVATSDNITISGELNSDNVAANTATIDGELHAGSVLIEGDLTVGGTYSSVPVETLTVTNPIIYMAESNPANIVDIGIVGSKTQNSVYSHTGFVKDASDGRWKLFSGVATEPTTTVDFTTWTKDDMQLGDVYAIGLHATSAAIGSVTNEEIQLLSGVISPIQDQIDSKLSTTTAGNTYQTIITQASSTEIGYLNGVTSNIQDQLGSKLSTTTAANTYQPLVSGVSNTEISYLDGVTSSIQDQLASKLSIVNANNTYQTIVSGVSNTEIGYLDGITSNIQNQIDSKLSTTTAANTYQPLVSNVSNTEISYLDGVTSSIQNQLDGKQEIVTGVSSTEIGYLDGVTSAIQTQINSKLSSNTAASTYAPIASPTFTGTVSGVTKSMVGLGNVDNTTDAAKPISTATQTALDLKAPLAGPTFTGTVVLPSTTSIGNVSAIEIGYVDGVTSSIQTQIDSKLASSTAASTYAPITSPTFTGTVSGITKTMVGLGNVDNTSDAAKPISTATQTAFDLKAPLASPSLTGVPTAPTAATATNTTQIATTAFVRGEVTALVNGASAALDTLGELAAALTADEATAATLATLVGTKAPIASPTFTGTVSGITKTMVGLGNVDNTSDASKPISTLTQAALDLKAPLASPTFTGTVTLPSGTVTSTMILDGTIATADIADSAITSAKIADGTIVDADINASAAIATSKISGLDTALSAKAPLASPALTGSPTAPTALAADNSTKIATTAYADRAASNATAALVASAPAALDTLNELAVALGNDASFSTTITNSIATKAPIASPTFTGTVSGITKSMVGLGDVDNTTDANKPISTATQTALDLKLASATAASTYAPIASPTFTGTVILPSGTVTSGMILDGTIVNADINSSAAIAATKIAGTAITAADTGTVTNTMLAGSIAASKITGTAITAADTGTVTSTMIADGTIVNNDISSSAAIALSKLATDPLARANHTGTQTASTISDFNTQVRTSKVTDLTAPSTSFSMNSQKITSLGTPTSDADAATKAYVDAAVNNINVHEAVTAATTANITLATAVDNGKTLDGVTLATGNRILVKNQSTSLQNGIYIVAASGAPTRATDYDVAGEVSSGDFVFVKSGTVNANTGWIQTSDVATVGTDPITFTQFSGAGTYTAGNGLTLTGTAFSINTATTVDLSTAQTLTNKTLTSPTITGTGAIAGTFTGNLTGNVTGNVSGNAGTVTNGVYTTDTGTVTSTMIADGTIVNADINSSAAIAATKISGTAVTQADTGTVTNTMLAGSIADSKLSTISTAGKVSNSATTATNLNTASAIVARDASGNFTAGTITAALTGNASTATKFAAARNINGTAFDGSADITITAANPNALTIGTGLSGTSYTGSGAVTIAIDSTVATLTGTQTLTNKTLTSPTISGPTVSGTLTYASGAYITFADATTQSTAGVPSLTTIVAKTASYTLAALTERDNLFTVNSASATSFQIPTDATLNYPIGTSIDVVQLGAGQVTVSAVTPVTTSVYYTPGNKLRTQYSSATMTKIAANTWLLTGDLSA